MVKYFCAVSFSSETVIAQTVGGQALSNKSLMLCLFLNSLSFFPYKETIWMFWSALRLILKEDSVDLQTVLCSVLYSLLLCLMNCGSLSLLGLPDARLQFREFAGLHQDSLSLHHGLETPEDSMLGRSQCSLCLPSLKDTVLCYLLCSVLQTNVLCILFLCLLFWGRVNLLPATYLGQKCKSYITFFLLLLFFLCKCAVWIGKP